MFVHGMRAKELANHLAEGDKSPVLLDVREPWEFAIGHLAHARLLPMGQIPHALDSLDPNEEIVVICHHGVRSRQVAQFLLSRGFKRVINLDDGIDGWSRDVDPSVPRY